MRRVKTIHFIGIGGVGMSGIAEVLANLGYTVTGSDLNKSAYTERLAKLGIDIFYSHIPENIENCDAVVVSSAISANNVELEMARIRRIPIVPRAEMLAELMRFKHGIAVAGTHGKTTTTSLIATIFAKAKLDPTFVVGGKVNSFGFNAKHGQGKYFIAEADESDASFLNLNPMVEVITNIDRDHMETYANDFDVLCESFLEFIHRLPFYGVVVLCIDDPAIRHMLPKITRPYVTYGFSPDADIRALEWQFKGRQTEFVFKINGENNTHTMQVNLSGKHNVLNSLAAIAVALDADISLDCIRDSLLQFRGVGRRFEVLGEFELAKKRIVLMDDYGHHPNEVKAVIEAIRGSWPGRRIIMVYQPHRYSRTQALFEDFASVLSQVDALLMLEIYSAGETSIPGIDSRVLCGNIRKRGCVDPVLIEDSKQLLTTLKGLVQDGDVVITQGAGDIGKVAQQLTKEIAECVI